MSEAHINPEDFYRQMGEYGALQGSYAAFARHVHLVRQCPECSRRVVEHFDLDGIEELAGMKDPWVELRLRRQRLESKPLLAELDPLPQEERIERVRQESRFWTEGLVQTLLGRCRERWFGAPQEALGASELALEILPHLHGAACVLLDLDELTALAWAHHGNTLRILSDLRGAAGAFRKAEASLAEGPPEERVQAQVLALHSSLLRAQRKMDDARTAIDEAIDLFAACEASHLQGEALLNRAYIRTEAGDREGALADLRQAAQLLHPQEGPRLPLVAASIELHLLCEMGRWEDARALLSKAQRLVRASGTSADRLRVRWCEGRIALTLGTAEAAEAAFREVQEGFGREGIGYDAALVSLDLAALYADQGRTAELKQLTAEMVPIFRSRDVPSEALAAVLLLCQAALEEAVSAELLAGLRQRIEQARRG